VSSLVGVNVLGAPPSALLVNGEYHVYVPASSNGPNNAHVTEFIRNAAGAWRAVDVVAAAGQSFTCNQPSALLTPNGVEHVFAACNGQRLEDFAFVGGRWTMTDVTSATNIPPASPGEPVGAVAPVAIGSDIHVYAFADTGSGFSSRTGVREFFLPSGGSWVTTDVSGVAANGPPPQIDGQIAAMALGSAVEVYVAGLGTIPSGGSSTQGHVLNFQGTNFGAGGGQWAFFDQTANSGNQIIFTGGGEPNTAAAPIVYGNSVQVFLNGGPPGTTDLISMVEVLGQWQTFDLSRIAVNGVGLSFGSRPFTLVDFDVSPANVHVYVPSGASLVEFFKAPNPTNWVVNNITALTGRTVSGIGATAVKNSATGEFHVFENG
jgi:hypothetical protein